MHENGQTVIFDFSVAFLIFIIVFTTLVFFFSDSLNEKSQQQFFEAMDLKANIVAETLVKSPGTPSNWQELDASEIRTIGLSTSDRSVDEEKLNAFKNLDYDTARTILGIKEFEFYFEFTGKQNVTAGLFPAANVTSVTVTRIVEFNGSEGLAKITIYRA